MCFQLEALQKEIPGMSDSDKVGVELKGFNAKVRLRLLPKHVIDFLDFIWFKMSHSRM